jgi:hypothetical protein
MKFMDRVYCVHALHLSVQNAISSAPKVRDRLNASVDALTSNAAPVSAAFTFPSERESDNSSKVADKGREPGCRQS